MVQPPSPSLFTEVVETEAEGKPACVCVLQLLLAFLHDGLEDSGGDVTVARAHSDHTARQSRHTCHLNTRTYTHKTTITTCNNRTIAHTRYCTGNDRTSMLDFESPMTGRSSDRTSSLLDPAYARPSLGKQKGSKVILYYHTAQCSLTALPIRPHVIYKHSPGVRMLPKDGSYPHDIAVV